MGGKKRYLKVFIAGDSTGLFNLELLRRDGYSQNRSTDEKPKQKEKQKKIKKKKKREKKSPTPLSWRAECGIRQEEEGSYFIE
jgi:hypothetical protein